MVLRRRFASVGFLGGLEYYNDSDESGNSSDSILSHPDQIGMTSTRSGRGTVDQVANLANRTLWNAEDEHGAEGSDPRGWKLFDPTMDEVVNLKANVTADAISNLQTRNTLPIRVKLSDSAMGLIVSMGVSIHRCSTYWPLNFNASGYALQQPPIQHFGHGYIFRSPTGVGNTIGQFGRDEKSMHILCGTTGYDGVSPLFTITRPSESKAIAPSSSSPATTPSKAPMFPNLVGYGTATPSLLAPSQGLQGPPPVPTVPQGSLFGPLTASNLTSNTTPQNPALPAVSRDIHMLNASSRGSRPKGHPLRELEATPPPPEAAGSSDAELSSTKADLAAASANLADAIKSFQGMVMDHADLLKTSERLDASLCVQADALADAFSLINQMMPLYDAVGKRDQQAINRCTELMTVHTIPRFLTKRNAVKAAYNKARLMRETTRNDLETPDGPRVFTHEQEDYACPNTLSTHVQSAHACKDPVEWFNTIHPVKDLEEGEIEPKGSKDSKGDGSQQGQVAHEELLGQEFRWEPPI